MRRGAVVWAVVPHHHHPAAVPTAQPATNARPISPSASAAPAMAKNETKLQDAYDKARAGSDAAEDDFVKAGRGD